MEKNLYSVERLPAFRQLVIDGMRLAERKHHIHGLIEVDITQARTRLREIKDETGTALSFTGFVVYCCARAVAEDRHVHAYRDWGNRLILFEDVDISLPVERRREGQPVVLQTVIRAANRKSVREIHQEIRELQTKELTETPWGSRLRWYVLIPGFIRILFFRLVERMPDILKKFNGTVMVTSVGMFGNGPGWGVPLTGHSLCVTVGGIAPRPVLIDDRLENREHLQLTLTFDHDIVDGGPAARFARHFGELLQSATGL